VHEHGSQYWYRFDVKTKIWDTSSHVPPQYWDRLDVRAWFETTFAWADDPEYQTLKEEVIKCTGLQLLDFDKNEFEEDVKWNSKRHRKTFESELERLAKWEPPIEPSTDISKGPVDTAKLKEEVHEYGSENVGLKHPFAAPDVPLVADCPEGSNRSQQHVKTNIWDTSSHVHTALDRPIFMPFKPFKSPEGAEMPEKAQKAEEIEIAEEIKDSGGRLSTLEERRSLEQAAQREEERGQLGREVHARGGRPIGAEFSDELPAEARQEGGEGGQGGNPPLQEAEAVDHLHQ